MTYPHWVLPALVACGISAVLTVALIHALTRRAILDLPNGRSLHSIPKPRGGGWAILGGFTGGLTLDGGLTHIGEHTALILAISILSVISWIDDQKSLPALPRFGAQIVAVGLGISTLHGHVFQGWLPAYVDYAASSVCWLWFINLFNFMDGMDGLAGGEALAIAFGLFLLSPHPAGALILAAAVLGFLVWNWGPSKIMLGDVGSIPLGYVLGLFLLQTADQGMHTNAWAAVILLPLYFSIDATFTILKRATRREKIWQAHRQHFYQQAVLAGRSHRLVATSIYGVNAVLVSCAVALAPGYPLRATAIGFLTVCLLLIWMRSKPGGIAA